MANYHTGWCKEHTTQFKLRLNNSTDADIIAFLNTLPNKQGFIKELIRKEMNGMKLRELFKIMDNDIAVTIHQEGVYDGDYLYISDVEDELLDREVALVETPANPNKTNLRISLK